MRIIVSGNKKTFRGWPLALSSILFRKRKLTQGNNIISETKAARATFFSYCSHII